MRTDGSPSPQCANELSGEPDLLERLHRAEEARNQVEQELAIERESRRIVERSAALTRRLHAVTDALAEVMSPAEVAAVAVREGLVVFAPCAARVQIFREGADLVFQCSLDGLTAPALTAVDGRGLFSPSPRDDAPIFASTPEAVAAMLPPRMRAEMAGDVRTAMWLPLCVKGDILGIIVLSFEAARTFLPNEEAFAKAIAQRCAHGIQRAALLENERRSNERTSFLAAAGALLGASLDIGLLLPSLARLIVGHMADWCVIELVDDGSSRQVAVVHADPEKVAVAKRLRDAKGRSSRTNGSAAQVMRTGTPELWTEVTDDVLSRWASDDEHLRFLRTCGFRSAMIVPIASRGSPLGALSFAWAETPRRYDEGDIDFALELARRTALLLENGRLLADRQLAVQARDDFLAAAGHELRTPLSALLMQIDSLCRLARKDAAFAPFAERLRKAAASGARLDRLITQLLDVSRIASGRLKLAPEELDLVDVVREVLTNFEDAAQQAGSLITLHAEGDVHGSWDRQYLEQVVGNLVGNAIKYGLGRPIDVFVRLEGEETTVRVIDRGIGIEPDQRARIFERFERAVGTRDFGGFGLGLWIAQQIVDASGGRVELESTPGVGSTFTVHLPLRSPRTSDAGG
jgi:signal transduction histidine kinase